jgi:hypothetical protein
MHRQLDIRVFAAAILALGAALALRAPESQGAPQQAAPQQAAPRQAAPARPAGKAKPTAEELEAARLAFDDVARVLLSPRCRNCHPAGDAPLHGDAGTPHAMNISRRSIEAGLACTACHRVSNSAIPGAPPGAPNWHLPGRDTPMVFEGHTPASLCRQLKDPAATGGRNLDDLVEHVHRDPFVLWGWQPGPGRSTPPITHAEFVAATAKWAAAGGPCPGE